MTVAANRRETPEVANARPLIGFYAAPGFAALDLAAPFQAFNTSQIVASTRAYRTALLSLDGRPVRSAEGGEIPTRQDLGEPLDTLVVVGGAESGQQDLDAIRRHAAAIRRVTSVGLGAFLLGGVGLLDGRRATTHWRQAEKLARTFPAARVEPDRTYVRDGRVWTSAGGAAGVDLALALIEQDHGRAHAREVARRFAVDWFPKAWPGTSLDTITPDEAHDRIARTLRFAQTHLAAPLTVVQLASVACLSPRQFTRTFQARTGETPAGAVERLRVEAARPRVEASAEPISLIGRSVGFSDPERMRRAFIRRFGVSPQAMRRRQDNALVRGGGGVRP